MRGLECSVVYDGKDDGANLVLLDANDVDSLVLNAYPSLLATDIKDVDRKGIQSFLQHHPYVLSANVSMTTGGKLRIEVEQRMPVVRLFYQDNEYYLSHQGTCMPLSDKHYCHVLVGSTLWEEPLLKNAWALNLSDTSMHRKPTSPMKIWVLAKFLHDNPQYGELFDQVVVADKGDLVLVPKLGSLTVVVGDTTQLDKKFSNLKSFLNQGIDKVGWDTYSSISLKYNNQVVCTRKKQ